MYVVVVGNISHRKEEIILTVYKFIRLLLQNEVDKFNFMLTIFHVSRIYFRDHVIITFFF